MHPLPREEVREHEDLSSRLRTARYRPLRRAVFAIVAASTLILSACGGGDDPVPFSVDVVVSGQVVGLPVVASNSRQTISIRVGQSIELDASEPVQWTLDVGGSLITGRGATVYFAGATVSLTGLSPSRIAIDTSAAFPLAAPVLLTFTATSTIDSALVATVDVYVTN